MSLVSLCKVLLCLLSPSQLLPPCIFTCDFFEQGDYVWTSLVNASAVTGGRGGGSGAVADCLALHANTRGQGGGSTGRSAAAAAGTGKAKISEATRDRWLGLGCGDYARPHWDHEQLQAMAAHHAVGAASGTAAVRAGAGEAGALGSTSGGGVSGGSGGEGRGKGSPLVSWAMASAPEEWGGLPEATRVASRACRACPDSRGLGRRTKVSGRGGGGSVGAVGVGGDSGAGAVHVIVTTDRPGSSLCAFLRTALWAGVDVTLLGWSPSSPPRWQVID